MRAAIFDKIESMTIAEREIPELEKKEVLIKVIKAGICGSDVHAYIGKHPFRSPPSILGHELVGKIHKVGEEVDGLTVGDLVTVEPHVGCGECSPCKRGIYNLCENKAVLGTEKWAGAFAEYIAAPEETVYKLPASLSLEEAVLVEPLAVGVHAVNVADVKQGDKVAILGSGPIGLVTAVAAHAKGATTICLTDAIETNLKVGKQLGATHTVNIAKESFTEYAKEHIGEFDHIFLTVGVQAVLDEAFTALKRKGKLITIALYGQKSQIDLDQFMISEVQMLGSSMYVKEDFEEAIEIVKSHKYNLKSLVTHQYSFDEIEEAMNVSLTKKGNPIKVVVDIEA